VRHLFLGAQLLDLIQKLVHVEIALQVPPAPVTKGFAAQ
jgi:hypothetical protein